MRRHVFAAFVPLVAVATAACGMAEEQAPAGQGTSRSYALADFTRVELAGPDDVEVRVGPAFSVRAQGDAEVLDRLRIERKGDALVIGRHRQSGVRLNGEGATVHVTMPAIAGASLAGSGDLKVDRAQGTAFTGSLAGSGDLSVGNLSVARTELSVAGSGSISLAGQGGALSVRIAGSGDVEAERLSASSADVSIAGSGSVRAAVDGAATVKLMGSGDVDLGPRARCTTSKMGSGSVRCGG